MPYFNVTASFVDWEENNGKRIRSTQRHSGKNPKEAGKAMMDNLWDEYGNNAEDIKIVSITPVAMKGGKTKVIASRKKNRKTRSLMTRMQLLAKKLLSVKTRGSAESVLHEMLEASETGYPPRSQYIEEIYLGIRNRTATLADVRKLAKFYIQP